MCRGVKPSCGVHSLLIRHYRPLRAPAIHGFDWYAPGCHACDALADEYGTPEALDASVTWNGERPTLDEVAEMRARHQSTDRYPDCPTFPHNWVDCPGDSLVDHDPKRPGFGMDRDTRLDAHSNELSSDDAEKRTE